MTAEEEPRYEAYSLPWVNALRDYLTARLAQQDLTGVTFTRCDEAVNPPARLLRGDGRQSIGWFVRIRDGIVEVGDYPLPAGDCDIKNVTDYELATQLLTMRREEEIAFIAQHRGKLEAEGKMGEGKRGVNPPFWTALETHDGFFAKRTAGWLWSLYGGLPEK